MLTLGAIPGWLEGGISTWVRQAHQALTQLLPYAALRTQYRAVTSIIRTR